MLPNLLEVLSAITSNSDATNTFEQRTESLPSSIPSALPAKLGVYTIDSKLGEGGMGAVYRGTDSRLKRPVAIKVMKPEIAAQPTARARFLREAQAMAAVRHEHVATIFAANEEPDGLTWLAMELLEGESLDDAIKRGERFDWKTIMRLGREVALRLQAAHAKKLIHRDIKPAIIWLESPEAKVKLLDFGLARQAEADQEVTGTGAFIGTPSYMSPEQANGEPVDGRCDLFSLGVLLYRLTTGKLPFTGATVMATITALATKDPTPVISLKPDCPSGLADLIHRLLSKNRDDRPASAKIVADELLKLERDGSQTQVNLPPIVEAFPVADPWASIGDVDSVTNTDQPIAKGKKPELLSQPKDNKQVAATRAKPWWLALPLLVILIGGFIIIKLTNKDGSVTELKVPEGTKIEVNGQTVIAEGPKKVETKDNASNNVDEEKIDWAAERKAAEKLLATGKGTIHLRLAKDNSQLQLNGKDAKLPMDDFTIVGGGFVGSDLIDAELKFFATTQVEWLRMDYCSKITAVGLTSLSSCRRLRGLWLNDTSTNDDGLKAIEQLDQLEDLNLMDTKCTLAGMATVKKWPHLRRLHCPAGVVNEVVLVDIVRHCPEMRELCIVGNDGLSLDPLSKLLRLRKIVCQPSILNMANVKVLLASPYLDSLELVGELNDSVMEDLTPLAGKLRFLRIFNNVLGGELTAKGYLAITKLTELEAIDIESVNSEKFYPDSEGLRALAGSQRLSDVKLPSLKRTLNSDFGLHEFRQARPDIHLRVTEGNQILDFPALVNWPGKDEGSVTIAPWNLPKDAPPPAIVPFSADEAKKHQEAWAKYIKQPIEVENKIGMKFRLIPPWEQVEDRPEGKVLVRYEKPFFMGSTEVTVAQFEQFVKATGYQTEAEKNEAGGRVLENAWRENVKGTSWKKPWKYPIEAQYPVTQISGNDMRAFCAWLSEQDKEIYRLPTESEWFAACRAGNNSTYGVGDDPKVLNDYGWFNVDNNSPMSPIRSVGIKKPNPFGLYDMHGNVAEKAVNVAESQTLSDRQIGTWWGEENRAIVETNVPRASDERFCAVGFRVLRQTTKEPLIPKFGDKPIMVAKGQPLSPQATVSRPASIPGVRSWSVELVGLPVGGPIAWHPKEDLIATGSGQFVHIVDRQGNLKQILAGFEGYICSICFSPDGKWLAVCDRVASGEFCGTVRLFETTNYTCRYSWKSGGWIYGASFSPSNSELLVTGVNGFACLINYENGSTRSMNYDGGSADMAWSLDGISIAILANKKIIVHDVATSKRTLPLTAPDADETDFQGKVAYSPDGKWLGCASQGKFRLWNAKTLAHVKTIVSPSARNFTWCPASKRVALFAQDYLPIEIFDVESGKSLVKTQDMFTNQLAWSPDGKQLV